MNRSRLQLLLVAVALAIPGQARSQEHSSAHHEFPIHHVSIFLGGATETEHGHTENGFAIGVEYEMRFAPRWGAGVLVEGVGQDTVRDVVILGLASLHLGHGFRLVAGPGMELGEKHDEFAFRLGVGYEFVLAHGLTLAPEVNVDLLGDERTTWVYGVGVGTEF